MLTEDNEFMLPQGLNSIEGIHTFDIASKLVTTKTPSSRMNLDRMLQQKPEYVYISIIDGTLSSWRVAHKKLPDIIIFHRRYNTFDIACEWKSFAFKR